MEKSASIANLASALLTFQSSIDKVSKDAKNPFYKSTYASLSNILETIQSPMSEAGLCVSQMPDGDSLTTILIHAESGEYIQATYNIHPKSVDPQGIGSAITYARRYALGAILSLNIDEDDDGNAAQKEGKDKDAMKAWLNPNTPQWTEAIKFLRDGNNIEKIETKYRLSKPNREALIAQAV